LHEGLRVADASAMPDIVGGNINATIIVDCGEGGLHDPPQAGAGRERLIRCGFVTRVAS
jgi:hypothetical protein